MFRTKERKDLPVSKTIVVSEAIGVLSEENASSNGMARVGFQENHILAAS